VAVGPRRQWTARWSQWEWLALFDAAAKNRLNEVVVPLDGLRATFAYSPGRSREAVFPFDVGPYSCVAEAYLAHQRGLALVADVARRRGLDLAFARRGSDGTLRRVNRPACLSGSGVGARDVGQVVAVSEEPGDFLGLPRVEEAAAAAGELLRAGGSALAVPFGPGARFRSGFLAQFAWDKALTPVGFYRHWAATLCDGEAAAGLADAAMRVDKLDEAVLAAAPKPYGRGVALALPVEADDLRCEWRRLRARAGGAEVRAHLAAIKAQSRALRELQRQLDPIIADIREALGSVEPPWEAEAFEAATATRRAERITLASYMLRSLLGALASVQEGTLAYYAGLAKPQEALAQLRVASSKYRKARRIMLWIAHGDVWTALEPSLVSTAEQVHVQASRLAEWLGPAAEAEPSVRLRAEGSEAIIHLFRSPEHHVYAVYLLEGHETIQLRLPAARARLFRRGKPPATIEATGGAFLVSVDTTPVYLVTRRAPWPGQLLR